MQASQVTASAKDATSAFQNCLTWLLPTQLILAVLAQSIILPYSACLNHSSPRSILLNNWAQNAGASDMNWSPTWDCECFQTHTPDPAINGVLSGFYIKCTRRWKNCVPCELLPMSGLVEKICIWENNVYNKATKSQAFLACLIIASPDVKAGAECRWFTSDPTQVLQLVGLFCKRTGWGKIGACVEYAADELGKCGFPREGADLGLDTCCMQSTPGWWLQPFNSCLLGNGKSRGGNGPAAVLGEISLRRLCWLGQLVGRAVGLGAIAETLGPLGFGTPDSLGDKVPEPPQREGL